MNSSIKRAPLFVSALVLGLMAGQAVAQPKTNPPPPISVPATTIPDGSGPGAVPVTPAGEAQKPAEKEKDMVLKPGVVASFGKYSKRAAINVTEGETPESPGENTSPIQGSVSRTGGERCTAKLTNPGKDDSYSVHFAVVGLSESGSQALKKTFSATLKPGETITREVSCRKGLDMQVSIISGKKLK